ncbi:hypothetical protein GYMLUDRAFT_244550 [Collybiopsis luxurians FD-317 M1]|uniref:Unplaced genomic scaffold GYMLUscaffold_28, whole genome shotgun sequence n=1 Tax=Collybiopsis luxurians FD-317 M1 TaxID=944289 RepID=A0A0D0CC79_9AGAR|nr:hypothetical protein GYMLUDRAFT_244550 [Collybiopsis luxurians FD-317 M1]
MFRSRIDLASKNETVEKAFIKGSGEQEREVERQAGGLPQITIQCPVYKESLELTIAPSVFSIKKAMQRYARQGGTSSFFLCDNGLITSEEVRQERFEFYSNHNNRWVAYPKHGSSPGRFKRAGKKASSINYGPALSVAMEEQPADASSTSTTTVPATDSSNGSVLGFYHSFTPSSSQQRFENVDYLGGRAPKCATYQASGTVKKIKATKFGQGNEAQRERWGVDGGESMAIIQREGSELSFVPKA